MAATAARILSSNALPRARALSQEGPEIAVDDKSGRLPSSFRERKDDATRFGDDDDDDDDDEGDDDLRRADVCSAIDMR